MTDGIAPRMLLDEADGNGRRDGRGSFHRSFAGPGTVRLEAPPVHGMWSFDHWELDGVKADGQGGGNGPSSRVIDVSLAASRTARAVYLPQESSSGGSFRRADSNGDGRVNISDPTSTLAFLFLGGSVLDCEDAGDANDDGKLDISDAVATLAFLFLGSGDIPPPGPAACGADPTADSLGCEARGVCE